MNWPRRRKPNVSRRWVSDVGAMVSIGEALTQGREQLGSHSESASLDTQVLLADLLGCSKEWLIAHPEEPLPHETQQEFHDALRQLTAGVPLPYVLGWWEFYGRKFRLTPDVLIPRPETEGLIEHGLRFLDEKPGRSRMIDVGTGSGCIATSMALERSRLRVIATDKSLPAIRLARENALVHKVHDRIEWLQSDLLEGIGAVFDLILANLPYIPTARLVDLPVAETEPRDALDGGEKGLDLIRRLIQALPDRLSDQGMALLEIDESHGDEVTKMASQILPSAEVRLLPDLAGLDRVVSIKRTG